MLTGRSGKCLGVLIPEDMSWKPHVDATVKKANNSLAFLRRNLTKCLQDLKAKCFKTLDRPIIEYATSARDPYNRTTYIQQMEAAQQRATRFVNHTASGTCQMIQDLACQTLQQRQQDAKLVTVYRITHGIVDIPFSKFFHPTSSCIRDYFLRYHSVEPTSTCTPSFSRVSDSGTNFLRTSPSQKDL